MKHVLAALLAICCAMSAQGIAQASIFVFTPEADALVSSSSADTNYGANTYLNIRDRSGLSEAYLRFSDLDLAQLSGLSIESATLGMYQYQFTYSPGDDIALHKVTGAWDEASLTWNNKPGYEALAQSSLNLASGNLMWREWGGLEGLVGDWLTGSNYGLVLENWEDGVKEELTTRFYSSQTPTVANRPYLKVSAWASDSTPDPVPVATPEPPSSLLLASGLILGGAGFRLKR